LVESDAEPGQAATGHRSRVEIIFSNTAGEHEQIVPAKRRAVEPEQAEPRVGQIELPPFQLASFSTWGNSGIEPDKGTGNQLSRKV
jgi:hypothetical protein